MPNMLRTLLIDMMHQYTVVVHCTLGHRFCWCSWEANTYGYHGDDGRKYSHPIGNSRSVNQGTEYGPTYTSGDTVGAGLNLETQEIFFTYAATTCQTFLMTPCTTACLSKFSTNPVTYTACTHCQRQYTSSGHTCCPAPCIHVTSCM